MSSKEFIPYKRHKIAREDIKAVSDALKQEAISRGPIVQKFEQTLAESCQAEFAVAFNSATSALSAAYFAAGLSKFDKVFTTPNTFIGTIAGIPPAQASLELIDIQPKTGNLDLLKLQEKINQPSTRGKEVIVPVHFGGTPVDMAKLSLMIQRESTVVIEDAAHALGSTYLDGSPVGNCHFSDMTVFSFDPIKNITSGEGGMVTTNSEELAVKLRSYRDNGIQRNPEAPWDYTVTAISGNFHMTEIQAALGLSQFQRIEEIKKIHRDQIGLYHKELDKTPNLCYLDYSKERDLFYHLFPILIDFDKLSITKQDFMLRLQKEGIGTQVHYVPLYKHPAIKAYIHASADDFPGMETYFSQTISLPLHLHLDKKDIKRVVETVKTLAHDCKQESELSPD